MLSSDSKETEATAGASPNDNPDKGKTEQNREEAPKEDDGNTKDTPQNGAENDKGNEEAAGCDHANTAEEAKMPRLKKTAIIASASVVIVAAIVVGLTFGLPRLQSSNAINAIDNGSYAEAASLLEGSEIEDAPWQLLYCQGMISLEEKDYAAAASLFQQAGDLRDAPQQYSRSCYLEGEKLRETGDYAAAIELFNESQFDDYQKQVAYCEAEQFLTAGNLESAIAAFTKASGTRDADQKYLDTCLAFGKECYEDKSFYEARQYFLKISDNEEAQQLAEACVTAEAFVSAEDLYKEGKLDLAQQAFKELPSNFSLDGVTVAQRIDTLSSHQAFVDLCGTWSTSDAPTGRSKQIWSSGDGRSEWWDLEYSSNDLTIACIIKDNGDVQITGTAHYQHPRTYSTLSSGVKHSSTSASINLTASSIPSTFYDKDDTTITYKNGAFTLKYKKYDDSYSMNFDYEYTATFIYDKHTPSSQ